MDGDHIIHGLSGFRPRLEDYAFLFENRSSSRFAVLRGDIFLNITLRGWLLKFKVGLKLSLAQ